MIAKKVFYLISLIFFSCFLQGLTYPLKNIHFISPNLSRDKTICHIENDQVFIFNKKHKYPNKYSIFDLSLNVFDLNKKKIIKLTYPLDKEVFKFGFSNNKNFVAISFCFSLPNSWS